MKIYDVTMTISEEMELYKGRTENRPQLIVEREHDKEGIRESSIKINLHTGTHFDAPLHIVDSGADISMIPVEKFLNTALVLDLSWKEGGICREDLENYQISPGIFVIIKTKNSFGMRAKEDFVYIAESGARFLAEKEIAGVGTDALGIERDQPDHSSHRILMGKGILILEGLDLRNVPEGAYLLIAFPLKIAGAEGSPARAVLIENPEDIFRKI